MILLNLKIKEHMKKVLAIIIPILLCFSVGLTASYFQMDSIQHWYPYLNKPVLTPPNIVFPIAWSILYLCMGVSIGLILLKWDGRRIILIRLFIIQLFLNFAWSFLFFYLHNPFLGLVDIILLDVVVLIYVIRSYSIKRISSYLFIPYLLWIFFATYLNAYILMYN